MKKVLGFLLLTWVLSGCAAKRNGNELFYLHRPAANTSAPAPAVILLHGYGSDERDLFSLEKNIPAGYHVFSVRAPISREGGGYAWFHLELPGKGEIRYQHNEVTRAREQLASFIKTLTAKHRLDGARIVVGGFSQGGFMSLDLMATHPKLFMGAASMSGGLVGETMAGSEKEKFGGRRVFIGHCTGDEMVAFSASEKAREFFEQRGAQVAFHACTGGHTIPSDELRQLDSWLTELLLLKK